MRKRLHTRVKLTETDLLRSFFLDFKVCIRKLPKDLCLGIDEIYHCLNHDSTIIKHKDAWTKRDTSPMCFDMAIISESARRPTF